MDCSELMHLIREAEAAHYVYILRRPNGEPFYVGKGVRYRVFCHEIEAKNLNNLNYKVNIIRSIWKAAQNVNYSIDRFFDDAVEALKRERELIDEIGRHDLKRGPLANLLDGGEGPSNPSEESRLKHAATLAGEEGISERAIGNRFVRRLWPNLKSAPIKPLSDFRPERISPNRESMALTPRQAATLAASAIANRVVLKSEAKLRRCFDVEDVRYCIENGAGRDILVSRMASLIPGANPADDMFVLSRVGYDFIRTKLDRDVLLDAGVLLP
jgi:hypothetical protein